MIDTTNQKGPLNINEPDFDEVGMVGFEPTKPLLLLRYPQSKIALPNRAHIPRKTEGKQLKASSGIYPTTKESPESTLRDNHYICHKPKFFFTDDSYCRSFRRNLICAI